MFQDCKSLEYVEIPNCKSAVVGGNQFTGCSAIEYVHVGSGCYTGLLNDPTHIVTVNVDNVQDSVYLLAENTVNIKAEVESYYGTDKYTFIYGDSLSNVKCITEIDINSKGTGGETGGSTETKDKLKKVEIQAASPAPNRDNVQATIK